MKSTDMAVSVRPEAPEGLRLSKNGNGNRPFKVRLAPHERELLPRLA